MDDEIIDLGARRAARAREALLDEADPDDELEGYRISYSQDGQVALTFCAADKEYTAVMPREAARRFGKRVLLAAERARRCLASTTSDQ